MLSPTISRMDGSHLTKEQRPIRRIRSEKSARFMDSDKGGRVLRARIEPAFGYSERAPSSFVAHSSKSFLFLGTSHLPARWVSDWVGTRSETCFLWLESSRSHDRKTV
jgi:hypothetical protein